MPRTSGLVPGLDDMGQDCRTRLPEQSKFNREIIEKEKR